MKLAIITPTCRSNPRYAEMARTLFASFRRAPPDAELQWIIVDDRLWWSSAVDDPRLTGIREAHAELPGEVAGRIDVQVFPPPPGAHRGPDVSDPLPAHNTARNAGLAALDPDVGYIVVLSDCTAVTADWITVALDLASKGLGWKCPATTLFDHVIPKDQPLKYHDCWDSLHPVRAETVAGPCWGVPKEAMTACGGFDSDYDGEDDLYDQEILLRLARVGVSFVTTRRAHVVRMNRTRLKVEVTTRSSSLRATRNQAFYQHLKLDKDRVLPGAAAAAARRPLPGGGAADRAARPAPAPAAARVAAVAPARARPNPAGRPGPAAPPARPPADVPDPARPGDDAGLEADGVAADTLTAFIDGAHLHSNEERFAVMRTKETPMPTTPADRPMTLSERARAAKAQKQERAAAEAAGVAAPLEDAQRCIYVPTQGGHKGIRCLGRKAHGGAHKYPPLEGQSPATPPPRAQPPAPVVSREPPEPPPAIADARDKIDLHVHEVQHLLADQPNDVPKNVVMVAVVLRREGILADEQTFRALIRQAAPPEIDDATCAAAVQATLGDVQAICATLPALPVSVAEFRALNAFAKVLDQWRKKMGLQVRADLSLYVRGYAAAADAGIDIAPADDLRALGDELASLEQALAAGEDEDDIVSVEPLTDAQVAAQAALEIGAPVEAVADPGGVDLTSSDLQAAADLLGLSSADGSAN